jgi:hypothetical protein
MIDFKSGQLYEILNGTNFYIKDKLVVRPGCIPTQTYKLFWAETGAIITLISKGADDDPFGTLYFLYKNQLIQGFEPLMQSILKEVEL